MVPGRNFVGHGREAKRGRPPLIDSLVRPGGVEVGAVLVENAVEMALAEHEDVVQAFSP